MPAARSIWERRMRETRTSGVRRGEQTRVHGRRLLRHARGNPDTDLNRSLNTRTCSPTLLTLWLVPLPPVAPPAGPDPGGSFHAAGDISRRVRKDATSFS